METEVLEVNPKVKKLLEIRTFTDFLEEHQTECFQVMWTNKKNETKCLTSIDSDYLDNLINWCEKNSLPETKEIFLCERVKRTTGNYPSEFTQLCKNYSGETWRLKIINIRDN